MHKKLLLIFLSGVIFTVPTNLFLKFFESSAYSNGFFIDYLLPKFYLSDVFVLAFIAVGLHSLKKTITSKKIRFFVKNYYLLTGLITLVLIRQFFVTHPLAAWWYVWKLIELGVFGYLLWQHRIILKKPLITYALICTIIFQSVLAIYQYHTQHSLVGYWFLGEPQLTQPFGLAKQVSNGVEKIAPYGTTAHPNILAGILAIYCLLLMHDFKKNSHRLQLIKVVVMHVCLYALFLTGSLSAFLTLLIGLLLIKNTLNYKQLLYLASIGIALIPLFLFLSSSSSTSVTRRNYLNVLAVRMFSKNILVGRGLNQFTTFPQFTNQEIVRFVQPAHHVGLLWLAETGLTGIAIIWLILKKIPLKKIALPLLLLMPIASLDHYLLTQQSGLLLGVLIICYSWRKAGNLQSKNGKRSSRAIS